MYFALVTSAPRARMGGGQWAGRYCSLVDLALSGERGMGDSRIGAERELTSQVFISYVPCIQHDAGH